MYWSILTPTYTFTSDGIAYSESDTITACNQDILDLVITSPTAVDYTFTRLSNGNVISSGTTPDPSIIQQTMQEKVTMRLLCSVLLNVS
ncbi:MAG: hypothetical protein IPP89_14245 [Saprospiraceae bacterium]|nr:hypothetical protein [Candidatus Brachybacter algidus]MBL0120097.1 hypothetical protein [Candidatus Brachybacter algidus]